MQRNLISNRQLRVFNALLVSRVGEANVYLNAMALRRTGSDAAKEWIELDLEAGDPFVFCYASDKPWFHRCAVMPIYCGVKSRSLEESIEYSLEIMGSIREWGYEAEEDPSSSLIRRLDVRFGFPRWHELDRDADELDESEVHLFPGLDDQRQPFTLGMTGDWFSELADHFFQESQVEGRHKNCIFNEIFLGSERLSRSVRWSRSLPNASVGNTGCTISYHDEDEQILAQADFLPIGTYSRESKTFLWSWENPGWLRSYRLTEELRDSNSQIYDQLCKVRGLAEDLGFVEFAATCEINVEEFESWEFVNMASRVLEGDATYMLPGDHGNTYGLLFHRDARERSFSQAAVSRLSKWRRRMQEHLDRHLSLYEKSSIDFARHFLASHSQADLEGDFVEAISDQRFLAFVRLRLSENANEERRFKETIRALLLRHGLH